MVNVFSFRFNTKCLFIKSLLYWFPDSTKAALLRLSAGVTYTFIFQLTAILLPNAYLLSENFAVTIYAIFFSTIYLKILYVSLIRLRYSPLSIFFMINTNFLLPSEFHYSTFKKIMINYKQILIKMLIDEIKHSINFTSTFVLT